MTAVYSGQTVPYYQWFPEIMPSLFGCPEIVAFNAVRNAVIDWCTESWYWQHTCFPQPGVPTIAEYDPDIPVGTKLLGIIDAWYDGRLLRKDYEFHLKRLYWDQNWMDVTGDPIFYVQLNPDQIRLVPLPNVPSQFQGLEMQVAVAPLQSSTSCMTEIYERFKESIAHGALSRLMLMANQPFSNPQMGVAYGRQFKFDKSEAKALVQRSKQPATVKVQFRGRAWP